ncbi:amidohydrolase family protein [Candidatus Stoquefichus massiliensis]|uniref:amidohydrolase family protein n=1 Tax=Candidatus Stoquefichus massiliensis TaxID=1470350 RepID=UPI00048485E8|nr:amidohydrolase family protein [Candidatus Stoquefichus massiliensis]
MKYAIINGRILDGTEDMVPQSGLAILIHDEKIQNIVSDNGDFSDYQIIDLKGQYIMPGLINMHVHLPASGKPKKKQTDLNRLVKIVTSCSLLRMITRKMCEGYAKTELLSGVTTLRTVGGIMDYDTQIRDRIFNHQIMGPRIIASNMAISVEGGHMAGSLAYIANNAREASHYVEKIAKDQPDLIKLMITGGVLDAKVKGEPGVLKMPADYVHAACDKAHRLGLKVAAHVESPEGVKVALENGVDTIEHGAKPDKYILNLFKEHGACLITTLSPAIPYALFDREISHATEMEQYNGKIVFDGIVECAKACLENHIPVGLGTDTGCPFITHYDMWREVYYFHKYCGVSSAFALHTATQVNAKLAGLEDITGSIESGKAADLIVCQNNPLEDLQALRHLEMVIVGGQIIHQPQVKKMNDIEVQLDKFL